MSKIAMVSPLQSLMGKGLLAVGVPQAYAAYAAPSEARPAAMQEALKWTALSSLPTAMIFPDRLEAAMASGIAGGIKGADNAIQSHKSKARSQRVEALVEALGKKFIPARTRDQIDGLPKASEDTSMNKHALLFALAKVAMSRKLAQGDENYFKGLEQRQQKMQGGMQGMMGSATPPMPAAPAPMFTPQQTQAAAGASPRTFGGTPATVLPGPAMFNQMGRPR